jgi:hypothetical protein
LVQEEKYQGRPVEREIIIIIIIITITTITRKIMN